VEVEKMRVTDGLTTRSSFPYTSKVFFYVILYTSHQKNKNI